MSGDDWYRVWVNKAGKAVEPLAIGFKNGRSAAIDEFGEDLRAMWAKNVELVCTQCERVGTVEILSPGPIKNPLNGLMLDQLEDQGWHRTHAGGLVYQLCPVCKDKAA
jgi:hypothetical protein